MIIFASDFYPQYQNKKNTGKTWEAEIQEQQHNHHSHSSVSIKGRLLRLLKESSSLLPMSPKEIKIEKKAQDTWRWEGTADSQFWWPMTCDTIINR